MEPRIQYAQTKDGVSIAFWTLGEGMPYAWMPLGVPSGDQRLKRSHVGRILRALAFRAQ